MTLRLYLGLCAACGSVLAGALMYNSPLATGLAGAALTLVNYRFQRGQR